MHTIGVSGDCLESGKNTSPITVIQRYCKVVGGRQESIREYIPEIGFSYYKMQQTTGDLNLAISENTVSLATHQDRRKEQYSLSSRLLVNQHILRLKVTT